MQTHKFVNHRQVIYLVLLAIAVFLFIPRLAGFDRVTLLLSNVVPLYVAIALVAEMLRYFASAGSTLALARLFDRTIPLMPMTEAFFAGAALNRVFSTGGAPGMVVRLAFLLKHQVTTGWVAAIYLIEDIIGLVIGLMIFAVGIITLSTNQTGTFVNDLAWAFLVGTIPLLFATLFILRDRKDVERIIHGIARGVDALIQRFFRRSFYSPERVEHVLDDFYLGMSAARRRPYFVAVSLGMNILRYVGGCVALYFSFLAIDQMIAPGVLILLYTTTSLLSSTSAVLGEMAIMGTGFAVLSYSLGLAPDVAVVALILSRTLSFWMPLPIGFLSVFLLRRQHHL